MPPSRAEAEREQRDAAADLKTEGARCVMVYDGGVVDAVSGVRASSPRQVRVHALLGSYKLDMVGKAGIVQGDHRVLIADRDLAGLSLAPLLSPLDTNAPTGFSLYVNADPEKFPVVANPLPAGVRRWVVVRLEDTVSLGGYPVLRVFQCRG